MTSQNEGKQGLVHLSGADLPTTPDGLFLVTAGWSPPSRTAGQVLQSILRDLTGAPRVYVVDNDELLLADRLVGLFPPLNGWGELAHFRQGRLNDWISVKRLHEAANYREAATRLIMQAKAPDPEGRTGDEAGPSPG